MSLDQRSLIGFVLCGPGPITDKLENYLISTGWSYINWRNISSHYVTSLAARETHKPIECFVTITRDATQPIRSVHYDEPCDSNE